MAKGSNPADAHRKQLKKKELAKNKEQRKKTREISTVKKDTRTLEADIRKLSSQSNLSSSDKASLAALKAELTHITKTKSDYVEAHPEHRKFVFPDRVASTSGTEVDPPGLYTKDGKLKHPERSVYYDPVFNPFGAPPPGMPYREKPPTPEEMAAFRPVGEPASESDDDDDAERDDDDDEIEMPAGPPPPPKAPTDVVAAEEDDSSSDGSDDDDIPMPVGPPPPKPTRSSRVRTLCDSEEESGGAGGE
ncbi:hypothetical protein RQP46_005177 [Phenoliferia psychrophenolica]